MAKAKPNKEYDEAVQRVIDGDYRRIEAAYISPSGAAQHASIYRCSPNLVRIDLKPVEAKDETTHAD